nr:hypothetical protein [Tanacetum cinerariifolium]
MTGFKMDYFKGMTYDEIIPLFMKHYNFNQTFLDEVNEEVKVSETEVRQVKDVEVESSKREGESLEQKIAKKQKMEGETRELKNHLQIVTDDDDDVYIDATPLASNIPISTYQERIEKLEGMVERLKEENRVLKELKSAHSTDDAAKPVMKKEKSLKQGRKIADIDADADVLSMMDVNEEEHVDVEEVLEVVKAAKLMTKVVTTAGATKNDVIAQVKINERLNDAVMKYQTLTWKPLTQAQARRNMIVYLKNMVGFKMDYFNGMTYDEIRPLFEKHYNYNQTFLDEANEGVKVSETEAQRPEGNQQNQVVAINGSQGRGNQARGRAFILGVEKARHDLNIMTDYFSHMVRQPIDSYDYIKTLASK